MRRPNRRPNYMEMAEMNDFYAPPHYMIYKKNSTFYAQDTNGHNDYNDSDLVDLLNLAEANMNEGETMFLNLGVETTTQTWNITNPINIMGAGVAQLDDVESKEIKGTVLKYAGDVVNVTFADDKNSLTISNLGIHGVDKSGVGLTLNQFHGTLDTIVIKECTNGLDLTNTWRSQINNLMAHDNTKGVVVNDTGTGNITFNKCLLSQNVETGFEKGGGNNVTLFGCDLEDNGQYGVDIASTACSQFLIDSCYFGGNPKYSLGATATGAQIGIGSGSAWPNAITIRDCYLGSQDTNVNITNAPRIWLKHGYNIMVEGCMFYQGSGDVRVDVDNDQGVNANLWLKNCVEVHTGDWVINGAGGVRTIGGNNVLPDWEDATGAWADPANPCITDGQRVVQYNSDQAGYRAWFYINGGWHYATLT